MAKKLGRGLSEIFGDDIDTFLDDISNGSNPNVKTSANTLNVNEIRPNPYQPRKHFNEEALQELAESIKINGVFQPIIVRKSLSGYELVAGERRLRASKIAGLKEIPSIIVEFDDKQMMEVALLENIQREDLSILEVANGYEQLIKKLNYTQEDLAKRVNKSRTNITNILRLLNLPDEVKELLNKNEISYGHARALLSLDDKAKMVELGNLAASTQMSVRELETLVKKGDSIKPKKEKEEKNPFIVDVENRLQKKYGTKVDISKKAITIEYHGTQDLNRILELMNALEESE